MSFPASIPFGATLAHEAYLQIRERILRGEIPMGGVLSRRQLAEELSMSFLPVTEAIQRLESEGMVESKPRVGTRVRIPTPNDIRERYIIREALETQSARLFCERASALEKRGLQDMAARLDEEAEKLSNNSALSKDPTAQYSFQSFHLQFHMQIAHQAGSSLLCEMLEKNHLLVFNWLFDINAESSMPPRWHGELAAVLAGDDPDAAGMAMGSHIRTGMSEIQEAIARRFSVSLPPIGRMGRETGAGSAERAKKSTARHAVKPAGKSSKSSKGAAKTATPKRKRL